MTEPTSDDTQTMTEADLDTAAGVTPQLEDDTMPDLDPDIIE